MLLEMGVTLQVAMNSPTFFTALPLPCITVNANKEQKWGGPASTMVQVLC